MIPSVDMARQITGIVSRGLGARAEIESVGKEGFIVSAIVDRVVYVEFRLRGESDPEVTHRIAMMSNSMTADTIESISKVLLETGKKARKVLTELEDLVGAF